MAERAGATAGDLLSGGTAHAEGGMIRLELYACGRILRVRLSPAWRWWAACCGGTVLIEAGPLALSWTRNRVWWVRP